MLGAPRGGVLLHKIFHVARKNSPRASRRARATERTSRVLTSSPVSTGRGALSYFLMRHREGRTDASLLARFPWRVCMPRLRAGVLWEGVRALSHAHFPSGTLPGARRSGLAGTSLRRFVQPCHGKKFREAVRISFSVSVRARVRETARGRLPTKPQRGDVACTPFIGNARRVKRPSVLLCAVQRQ